MTLALPNFIEHADALNWLEARPAGEAAVVLLDPPYAITGKYASAATGSVFGPFSLLAKSIRLAARAVRVGGIVPIFVDWRRLPDVGYLASITQLMTASCLAWVRTKPGTGGLFRTSWDPILICSKGQPTVLDRAAVRNVVVADYPTKRRHPFEKPREVFELIYSRVCAPGDLVLDPFAGSGASRDAAEARGLRWAGCDVDPSYAGGEESPSSGDDRREADALRAAENAPGHYGPRGSK